VRHGVATKMANGFLSLWVCRRTRNFALNVGDERIVAREGGESESATPGFNIGASFSIEQEEEKRISARADGIFYDFGRLK
jgi:hypothetical protein